MKMKTIFATMALLVVASISASYAQTSSITGADDWTLLGTRTVDYTLDRDVVMLEKGEEAYTSLKFVIKNGTLNMHKATIHFSDGANQDFNFSNEMSQGNDGQKIEMNGNKRKIDKVTFWYDTKRDSADRSTVELWGKN